LKTSNNLFQETRKLLEKEGEKGWRLAKEIFLKQTTSNSELDEAMKYIMLVSPPDYFRPALLSFCSRAVGGTQETTIPIAASMVLFARAIGIHDDIIDRSKRKNKHTTVFGKFGKDVALILADILLMKGYTQLRNFISLDIPTERIVRVLDVIDTVWFEQSEGGINEIQDRGKTNISPQKCLKKIEMIASETEAITMIGSILGAGSELHTEKLGKYGRLLSVAYILRNELVDMLDLKALQHRMRHESLPLPLIYAFQDSRVKPELLSLISSKKLTSSVLRQILQAVNNAGGMEYGVKMIERTVENACSCISILKNEDPLKALNYLAKTALLSQEDLAITSKI
jgi:geranylgeranyl pyrophosphate synthase